MSIELVMPSNCLILCIPFSSRLPSFPAPGSFPMSQFFTSGGQSIGVAALVSVLPVNIQDRFPLGWTGWISLQSKGHSRAFSNTTSSRHWEKIFVQLGSKRNDLVHTFVALFSHQISLLFCLPLILLSIGSLFRDCVVCFTIFR